VAALGGPADLLERPAAYLPVAPVVLPVPAPRSGVLTAMQTRDIGLAVVELGGGRRKAGDALDLRVGLSQMRQLGEHLEAGEPIVFVHAADRASAERAAAQLQEACTITDAGLPWLATPCVMATIAANAAQVDRAAGADGP
jgi:thymidine phosphorylase